MSIITATYNRLAANAELNALLASSVFNETEPAIYEHWAGDDAKLPYVTMSFLTDESNHWAKHQSNVTFSIFAADSIQAEAIKDRIIKILDRQEITEENENLIRFFYDSDDRLDELETNIVHLVLSFRAYFWRKTFIDYLNGIMPHDEPPAEEPAAEEPAAEEPAAEPEPIPAGPNRSVAIVTIDATNAAATIARDVFVNAGYTADIFAETAVTADNLAGYGIIALTRYSGYENTDTAPAPAWYSHILGYLDAGKPLLIGKSVLGSAGIYLRSLTHVLGIGKEYAESSVNKTIYRNRAHAIDGTTGDLTIATTDDYMNIIFEAYGFSGTDIATVTSAYLNQKRVIACEKGITTTAGDSRTLNARVVWASFLYNRYGYTTAGQEYIVRMAEWLLNQI